MKLIDCRSGQELYPGKTVLYSEGIGFHVVAVMPGLASVRFVVDLVPSGERIEVRGPVRYLHPSFLFQRVGFYPS